MVEMENKKILKKKTIFWVSCQDAIDPLGAHQPHPNIKILVGWEILGCDGYLIILSHAHNSDGRDCLSKNG